MEIVLTPFAVRVLPTATKSPLVVETSKNIVPLFNVRLPVRFKVPTAPKPPGASCAPEFKITLPPMFVALPLKTVTPEPATVRLALLVIKPVKVSICP